MARKLVSLLCMPVSGKGLPTSPCWCVWLQLILVVTTEVLESTLTDDGGWLLAHGDLVRSAQPGLLLVVPHLSEVSGGFT